MLSEISRKENIRKIKLGMSLEFASDVAKGDRLVVLEAVKINGLNLEHAANQFKSDAEIVKEAVKQNYKALDFVQQGLKEQIIANGVDNLVVENTATESDDLDNLIFLALSCETEEELSSFIDTLFNCDANEAEKKILENMIVKLLNKQVEIAEEIKQLQQKLLELTPGSEKIGVFPVDANGNILNKSINRKKF